MKTSPLPPVVLDDDEVAAMLEYSCSLPTGTTIGKRWKRLEPFVGRHDERKERWLGEYVEHTDPTKVGIRWRPLLTTTEAAAAVGAILWWAGGAS